MNTADEPLFEWAGAEPRFRGLRVSQHRVRVGSDEFTIAALQDAAALLDDAELVEEFQRTDRLPYGLELWPAAIMLADHLYHDEPGHDRTAIELGCGVGLVSLAAAKRGWRVTATDADPTALRFAEYNALCNGLDIRSFHTLDWNNPPAGTRYTRVFGADVLYQRVDHRPLLGCIHALLDPGGVAYIADPCRGVAAGFAAAAEQGGFTVCVQPTSASLMDGKSIAGRIFALTLLAGSGTRD